MSLRPVAFLVAAALLAVLPAPAHAASPPVAALLAAPPPSAAAIDHLLNRIAFGPTDADIALVKKIGIAHYIEEQLDPTTITEPEALTRELARLDTLPLDPVQLFILYGPPQPITGVKPSPEDIKSANERARVIVLQAQDARVLKAIYSRRQLQQVMVEFWYNHFNVFAGKGLDRLWVGAYERQAIRKYALGRFSDLLQATALHPAMLIYLDNAQNTAPGAPGKMSGINENFAREVMELQTLGVDGGYTQKDVVALAHIMTGWGIDWKDMRDGVGTAAAFDPVRHDFSPKTFLGHAIASGGAAEAEEALDLLARSPATAHHIAFELAQYFVADAPPPALVNRLAQRFLATDGDIRMVLQTLFASPEFWASTGQKYKTPYQYVISAARVAGVPVTNPRPLVGFMARLGMPLYYCQTPDGYKNTEAAWLSPDATTLRIAFATALARGSLPLGVAPPPPFTATPIADRLPPAPHTPGVPVASGPLEAVLGPTLDAHTRAAIAAAPAPLHAALILGSPDFMRH